MDFLEHAYPNTDSSVFFSMLGADCRSLTYILKTPLLTYNLTLLLLQYAKCVSQLCMYASVSSNEMNELFLTYIHTYMHSGMPVKLGYVTVSVC